MAELDSLWRHDRAEAERILAEYTAAGFNHVPTGPVVEIGYHGHYPDTDWRSDPEGFAEFLSWLDTRGLAFTLFVLPDVPTYFGGTAHGWDLARVRADLGPLYTHPAVQALTRRVCLAWEQYAPMAAMAEAFDLLREWFPDAERFWHNPPGHDAPCSSDEHSLDGWVSAAAHGCTGYMFQTWPPQTAPHDLDGRTPIEMLRYDLWDAVRRLHGKPDSPWGNPPVLTTAGHLMTIEYAEGIAYGQYWADGYEHLGPLWAEAAQSVAGVSPNTLDGAVAP